MSNILSIDTSTKVCSVAIHQNGELLASQELFLDKSHSAYLATIVENLTTQTGLSFQDYDAFAVGMGPGSYTGLRIGVSTVKGYCYALDKPLIAVNSLESMAKHVESIGHNNKMLCPMIDARRMEVYCLFYKNGVEVPTNNEVIDEGSFAELLTTEEVLFFGDGAGKCKEVLTSQNATFLESINTTARGVGLIASEKFKKEEFEDVAYFEPYYHKEFQTKPSTKKLI